MNADNALKTAYDAVLAEEHRLASEYARVKAARIALERGMNAKGGGSLINGKSPAGALREAILGVLAATPKPMGNESIRDALRKNGYAHSLTPLHVSKTLTKLHQGKKIKRVGSGTGSQYVRMKP